MIVTFITNGQSEIDSVKINNDFLNKCKCINPASLIGKWESTDTIKNRIEFFFRSKRNDIKRIFYTITNGSIKFFSLLPD